MDRGLPGAHALRVSQGPHRHREGDGQQVRAPGHTHQRHKALYIDVSKNIKGRRRKKLKIILKLIRLK